MCGIAGFIAAKFESPELLKNMTDVISHRGPDGEGFLFLESLGSEPIICSGNDTPKNIKTPINLYTPTIDINEINSSNFMLGISHRRLSILELSTYGHQPMCSIDRSFWITYNGEIYNYLELKVELESLGHKFLTNSDTEVILCAYKQWGKNCISRFNGMWAFCIYDTLKNTFFISRDRFGVKPLYYWISNCGTFYFASEIKQFTVLPSWKSILNSERVSDFLLSSKLDHTDETLFSGVKQLLGGHYIELKIEDYRLDKRIQITKWYELNPQSYNSSFEDATFEFKKLFENSVEIRLRADVNVGTGLSGGLDSSSIVCEVNKLLRNNESESLQNSFSACSTDKRFDEKNFIEIVANHTKIKSHYTFLDINLLITELDSLLWHQDEPFSGASIYAQSAVFKLTSETAVKVTLDGQGSDEILGGYHIFFTNYLSTIVKKGQLFKFLRESYLINKRFGYSFIFIFKSIINNLLPKHIQNLILSLKQKNKTTWLNKRLVDSLNFKIKKDNNISDSNLKSASIFQLQKNGFPAQLHWADRNSMRYSIESRMPFLDFRLVEFVLSCPDNYKIQEGVTKRLLRAALSDTLPEKIANRIDKKGFITPEESWVCELAQDFFLSEVIDAVENSRGILLPNTISLAESIIYKKVPYDPIIWRWITFGRWMKLFSVDYK